jgi:hypothetical protein
MTGVALTTAVAIQAASSAASAPEAIRQLVATWHFSSYAWLIGGYTLSIAGVIFGLAVTSYADTLDKPKLKRYGFFAAVSAAILTTLNPIQTGNQFRQAWRVLSNAVFTYEFDESNRNITNLIAAVREGEGILQMTPTQNQIQKPSGGNQGALVSKPKDSPISMPTEFASKPK